MVELLDLILMIRPATHATFFVSILSVNDFGFFVAGLRGMTVVVRAMGMVMGSPIVRTGQGHDQQAHSKDQALEMNFSGSIQYEAYNSERP